jgi:hypothetical protein
MKKPQGFSKEKREALFGLLTQAASAEKFESSEVAREIIGDIEFIRSELD